MYPQVARLLLSARVVGRDTGTQVSRMYGDPFAFDRGELDRVLITISDDATVPPRKLPAVYY